MSEAGVDFGPQPGRLRRAAKSFILWLLPIYGVVLAITGTQDHGLLWALVGVALVSFVLLVYWDTLRRLAVSMRLFFTGTRLIAEQVTALHDALGSIRDDHQSALTGVQATVTETVGHLRESVLLANDMAVFSVQRTLGAQVMYIDKMSRPVYILHSHRPEIPVHSRRVQVEKETYTAPAVPVDEASCIPLLSLWVFNSRPWLTVPKELPITDDVKVLCSCVIGDKDDSILQESLIVVGSTLYNPACQRIQLAALERNWLHFSFGHEAARSNPSEDPVDNMAVIFGVPGGPAASKSYRPDPPPPISSSGKRLVDYGLFTRIPNPLAPPKESRASFVTIIAGCLLAGQLALTEWITRPDVLYELSVKHGDRPFQYVVEVEYEYDDPAEPMIDHDSLKVVDHAELHTLYEASR
jgi:hypothetical protein